MDGIKKALGMGPKAPAPTPEGGVAGSVNSPVPSSAEGGVATLGLPPVTKPVPVVGPEGGLTAPTAPAGLEAAAPANPEVASPTAPVSPEGALPVK